MTIAFEAHGDGAAILLVHAGIADRRMWRGQVPILARDHHVAAIDLRGFGETPHASGPFSHAEDLCHVLDRLEIDRATVVGGSFGAKVALELAVTRPERVERLVLCPPVVPGWEWSERIRRAWQEEDEALEAGDLDRATEVNLELWVDGPTEGAAHVVALERPQEFNAALLAFLEDPPT